MKTKPAFRLSLQQGDTGPVKVPLAARRVGSLKDARPTVAAEVVGAALMKTLGAQGVVADFPTLANWPAWFPTATFTVCQKTGTASFLDIWDCDHFDGFTDMQHNLSACKVWFSAGGFSVWGSPETTSGVVNCYFRAPKMGNYVCNAQLESYGGPAVVDCSIDSSSFGALPFTGAINQPHPCSLTAGYHSFRIKQLSGAFFFISLTVWKA